MNKLQRVVDVQIVTKLFKIYVSIKLCKKLVKNFEKLYVCFTCG